MKFMKGSNHKIVTEDGGDSRDETNAYNWNYNYFFLRQAEVLSGQYVSFSPNFSWLKDKLLAMMCFQTSMLVLKN